MDICGRGGPGDIEFRDGDFVGSGGKGGEGGCHAGGVTESGGREMGLRADAVNGDTGGAPRLDLGNQTLGLGVGGRVEVVVVDVEFGVGVLNMC